MAEKEKSRGPSRIWKWMRRIIVTIFILSVLLVSATFIYAAVVNRQGERALKEALADVRARGLPLNRKQIYGDAGAASDEAGRLYLAAFELTKGSQDKYDDLPYIGFSFRSKDMPLRKPLDPALVEKIRAFAEENKRYFTLLEEARSRNARIPLLEFYSWQGLQLSALSGAKEAAKRWLLLSLPAQAEGKDAEAMRACAKAVEMNRMFDGQPLVITSLIRVSIGSLVVGAIEDVLGRAKPDPKDLQDLRDILLAEDARIDPREILKGELAFMVETAANPDLAMAGGMYLQVYMFQITEQFNKDLPAATEPWVASLRTDYRAARAHMRLFLGTSWLWHWMCPGAIKATHAHEIRRCLAEYYTADVPLVEQARRAKRLTETGKVQEGGFSPRGIQLLLQGKAHLRAAAVALSVENYRIRHKDWPEKLADVAADLPKDPFTGKPMKYKRTDEGCVIYSIGENLQDDGGKDRRSDGDDICFRLFDVGKRNKP